MQEKALLLIAHGSKITETNDIMLAYVDALKKRAPHLKFSHCYLQFMAPDIKDTVGALYDEGVRHIKAFPFFLFGGNHVKKDIPAVLENIRETYPDLTIDFLPSIGFDEKLVDIILERVMPL